MTNPNPITATRRAINERTKPKQRAGASKHQLRLTLESGIDPEALRSGLRAAGIADIRKASADELHELNYAFAWSRAWGRSVDDFYATGGLAA